MASHIGKDGSVYVGSNAVAELIDWSIDTTANTVNDTVMGDTWETSKVTTKAWSGSINVQWDPSDTTGQEGLKEGDEVTLNMYPLGNTSGLVYWSGTIQVTGVNRTGSNPEIVKASVSFTGNGELTQSTVA